MAKKILLIVLCLLVGIVKDVFAQYPNPGSIVAQSGGGQNIQISESGYSHYTQRYEYPSTIASYGGTVCDDISWFSGGVAYYWELLNDLAPTKCYYSLYVSNGAVLTDGSPTWPPNECETEGAIAAAACPISPGSYTCSSPTAEPDVTCLYDTCEDLKQAYLENCPGGSYYFNCEDTESGPLYEPFSCFDLPGDEDFPDVCDQAREQCFELCDGHGVFSCNKNNTPPLPDAWCVCQSFLEAGGSDDNNSTISYPSSGPLGTSVDPSIPADTNTPQDSVTDPNARITAQNTGKISDILGKYLPPLLSGQANGHALTQAKLNKVRDAINASAAEIVKGIEDNKLDSTTIVNAITNLRESNESQATNDILSANDVDSLGQTLSSKLDIVADSAMSDVLNQVNDVVNSNEMGVSWWSSKFDSITSFFVSGECTDTDFVFNENHTFTLKCDFSDKLKVLLGFLISVWSFMEVVETMYTGIVPKGSPQHSLWGN